MPAPTRQSSSPAVSGEGRNRLRPSSFPETDKAQKTGPSRGQRAREKGAGVAQDGVRMRCKVDAQSFGAAHYKEKEEMGLATLIEERKLTMKGLAMRKIGEIGWVEKDKPQAGPLDAIVRPLIVAPCTSDVHTVWEGAVGERNDMILGHEAVAEVYETGAAVKDFKPGDRVVVPAITPDWNTVECAQGYPMHSGGMLGGWKLSNTKDGCFSEFFHINNADMNLAHLPPEIPLQAAIMAPDMMTTGFHGVELADVKFGDTVVVIGIGPVGLMSVAGAAMRGAARIIAVGSRPPLIEAARYYGATDIVNYREGDIVQQVLELTGNKGVDATILAGGGPEVMRTAVILTAPGGTIGNVNYFGEGENLPIPRAEWGVGMAHKHIKGGLTPGGRLRMEKMVQLIKHNRIDPTRLVSHVFTGLDQVEEALILMRDKPRDLIKPVVIVE